MTAYEFVKHHNIKVCPDALEALEAFDGTMSEYFYTHPRGAFDFFWCIENAKESITQFITPERLDRCAIKYPLSALVRAATLLTPERLDWCAEKYPEEALVFAAHLLTPERLAWCKAQCED